MTTKRRHFQSILLALSASAALLAASAPIAQNYPSKPITLLVGYPAGGSVDLVARTISEQLGKALNTSIVVENVAGASGSIAAQKLTRAAPDGYTLFLGSNNEMAIVKSINDAIAYDTAKDFTAISHIASLPMVLVGHKDFAPNSTDELIAYAKAKPNGLSYATSGVGTGLHFVGELIALEAQIQLVHVPYKGAGPMIADLLGGQVQTAIFVLSSALPHINAGKMKAYGVSENMRSPALPNVPTLNESKALANVNIATWFGLYGPAKLDANITQRLNAAIANAIATPSVRTKLMDAGMRLSAGTPAALAQLTKAEGERFLKIATAAKIKAE